MAVTLCMSGALLTKAGERVHSDFTGADGETNCNALINQAEAVVCMETREDWITNYSTFDSIIKLILEEVVSNISAMYAIIYDMSGYTSRAEAQTMLDVLIDGANRGLKYLKDKKKTTFIKNS